MRLVLAFSLCVLSACQHAGPHTDPHAETSTHVETSPGSGATASPYAGQEAREIKALSAEAVRGYLAGAGLGYGRAAELNGYPGPRHVLELADSLALTADQRRRVEESFRAMRSKAQAHGRAFVAAEAALDRAFADGRPDREAIRALAEDAARIEAQVRLAHLEAHLDMMAVLTPSQVTAYSRLRGYEGGEHH